MKIFKNRKEFDAETLNIGTIFALEEENTIGIITDAGLLCADIESMDGNNHIYLSLNPKGCDSIYDLAKVSQYDNPKSCSEDVTAALIEHEETTWSYTLTPADIEEMEGISDSDYITSITKDAVTVAWTNLNEGINGDYDPRDSEDINLLRLDILDKHNLEIQSVCTHVPASCNLEILNECLNRILNFVLAKGVYNLTNADMDAIILATAQQPKSDTECLVSFR